MLQSVASESYAIRTRLSRPELQASKGRRQQLQYSSGTSNGDSPSAPTTAAGTEYPMDDDKDLELGSDDDDGKGGKSKSRRELPAGAVQTLKAWLLSPEHFTHPYPTPQDQAMLMAKTGIDKKQLKNWFTNARRRIWKPMLKKQIEQGKITTTGVPGGLPGAVPGLMVPTMASSQVSAMDNPHSVQAMRVHYQQAVQGQPLLQQQQVTVDANGYQVYVQQPHIQQQQLQPAQSQPPPLQPPPPLQQPPPQQQQQQQLQPAIQDHSMQQYYLPPADSNPGPASTSRASPLASMHQSNSIGSLPPMTGTSGTGQLSKTDSHAVLMELFARDQDLVRQATESARMKAAAKKQEFGAGQQQQMPQLLATQSLQQQGQQLSSQHPMKTTSQPPLVTVPSLNSWPHFSSISSLNNLGNMPGVKSITSMSGVDLANQGNVNKMGNLAQVKSIESMGKNDSYAFLEVFFGDRSLNSMNNLGGRGGTADFSKGKREREEDNDVGLSLDDEGPSTTSSTSIKQEMGAPAPMNSAGPQPLPLPALSGGKDVGDNGTLKRAYDDAMAARGLISVSRSSEKLTDLALPAKMQRSLSQEYIRQNQNPRPQVFGQYSYTADPSETMSNISAHQLSQQQYPGQHPGEPLQQQQQNQQLQNLQPDSQQSLYQGFCTPSSSDPAKEAPSGSVEVPAATKCAICQQTNVDTQLRPCGHMFHERCLKPSLHPPVGPPRPPQCPVDQTPMQSALLAVPTDNPQPPSSNQQKQQWNAPSTSTNQAALSAEVQRTTTPI